MTDLHAWQAKFCEQHQALLHGDLHTGSLMVTASSTWMIDAEFAFYGPIAFDVCKLIANLLLAFLAADGHATADEPRTEQRRWMYQVWASDAVSCHLPVCTSACKLVAHHLEKAPVQSSFSHWQS